MVNLIKRIDYCWTIHVWYFALVHLCINTVFIKFFLLCYCLIVGTIPLVFATLIQLHLWYVRELCPLSKISVSFFFTKLFNLVLVFLWFDTQYEICIKKKKIWGTVLPLQLIDQFLFAVIHENCRSMNDNYKGQVCFYAFQGHEWSIEWPRFFLSFFFF